MSKGTLLSSLSHPSKHIFQPPTPHLTRFLTNTSIHQHAAFPPERPNPASILNPLGKLSNILKNHQEGRLTKLREPSSEHSLRIDAPPPYHFHVYATKHNTHITLTRPNRDPILSVSTGSINFKKAARGTYDAAYQLAAWTMKTMLERGLMHEIGALEVVLRGFGVGRDAVTRVLLGTEGRNIRGKVVRVTDATRLKFGGTRSPKPRRLG